MQARSNTSVVLPALAAGLLLSSGPAHAGPGPDQSQTMVNSAPGIIFFGPVGQSFTPTQTSLDYVTLAFLTAGRAAGSARVDILSGEGFSGTVLGSSPAVTVSDYGFGTGTTTTFTFASPIGLTPGSPYTLRIVPVSGDGTVGVSTTNPYAGGQSYFRGSPMPTDDLYFVEGTRPPAAVPEPSSVASLGVGGLGLLGLLLRARRRKAPAA